MITEPGAQDATVTRWEGKLVFAEGVESTATAIRYYTDNGRARLARQELSWNFAKESYSLQDYLKDLL